MAHESTSDVHRLCNGTAELGDLELRTEPWLTGSHCFEEQEQGLRRPSANVAPTYITKINAEEKTQFFKAQKYVFIFKKQCCNFKNFLIL